MTVQEMIDEVKIQLRSRNSTQTRIFQPEHILSRLNKAQSELLDSFIKEENDEGYFEINDIGVEVVSPFITTKRLSVTNNFVKKPDGLRYILNITANEKNASRNVKILKSSYSKSIKSLPYFRSCESFLNAEQINNGVQLTPYIDEIETIDLLYIRNPATISLEGICEFRESFHYSICDLCATLLVNEAYPNQAEGKISNNKLNPILNN